MRKLFAGLIWFFLFDLKHARQAHPLASTPAHVTTINYEGGFSLKLKRKVKKKNH